MSDNENKDKIKEKTHVEKRRKTTIKLVVTEKIHKEEESERKFLADLFNFPEYTQKEFKTNQNIVFPLKKEGEMDSFFISESVLSLLNAFGVDETTVRASKYYKEEINSNYITGSGRLTEYIKTTLGMNCNTSLHAMGTGYEYKNDAPVYYYELSMTTTGESKTTIKSEHKENVSKLLHYLRLNGIMLHYDCDWSFEGNRSCSI